MDIWMGTCMDYPCGYVMYIRVDNYSIWIPCLTWTSGLIFTCVARISPHSGYPFMWVSIFT